MSGEEAEAAAPVETTNGTNGSAEKKEPRRNRDNDVPIEELFDLTQPIPSVCSYGRLLMINFYTH